MCSADLVAARFAEAEESFVGIWGTRISLISVRMACAYLGDGKAFGGHFALGVKVDSEEEKLDEDAKRRTCGTSKRPPSTEGINFEVAGSRIVNAQTFQTESA